MGLFKTLFSTKKTKPEEKVSMILLLMGLEEELLKQSKSINLTPITVDNKIVLEKNTLETELNRLKRLNLSNTKNYRLLEEKFNELNNKISDVELHNNIIKENQKKAVELVEYVKRIKHVFGPKATLVSYSEFDKLCKKYSLVTRCIKDYKGSIPENNLRDIEKFNEIYEKVKESQSIYYDNKNIVFTLSSSIGIKDYNIHRYLFFNFITIQFATITKIVDNSTSGSYGEILKKKLKKFEEENGYFPVIYRQFEKDKNNNIRLVSDWFIDDRTIEKTLYKDILDNNIYSILHHTFLRIEKGYVGSPLLIAAEKKDFEEEKEIKISHIPRDPIVYFNTPFGVVVITAWGEESEDVILKHYMEVNNLLSK